MAHMWEGFYPSVYAPYRSRKERQDPVGYSEHSCYSADVESEANSHTTIVTSFCRQRERVSRVTRAFKVLTRMIEDLDDLLITITVTEPSGNASPCSFRREKKQGTRHKRVCLEFRRKRADVETELTPLNLK